MALVIHACGIEARQQPGPSWCAPVCPEPVLLPVVLGTVSGGMHGMLICRPAPGSGDHGHATTLSSHPTSCFQILDKTHHLYFSFWYGDDYFFSFEHRSCACMLRLRLFAWPGLAKNACLHWITHRLCVREPTHGVSPRSAGMDESTPSDVLYVHLCQGQ